MECLDLFSAAAGGVHDPRSPQGREGGDLVNPPSA